MKRIFCCVAIGGGLLIGSPTSASAPHDGEAVLASFTEWLASTAGTEADMSELAYLACVVNEDGSAFCYGLSIDGWTPLGSGRRTPPRENGPGLATGRSPTRIDYGHPTT